MASASLFATASARESRAYLHSHNLPGHGVAIAGYSPVAYFTRGKVLRGKSQFAVEHDGITNYLASGSEQATFRANPFEYVSMYRHTAVDAPSA